MTTKLGAMRSAEIEKLVNAFGQRFKITDSGEVNVYLSIHVERNWANRTMALAQTDYIDQMWATFNPNMGK